MGFFIDVAALPADFGGFIQVLTVGGLYGYLLMYASNLISDGSELLLLVPSMSGLVGSVVLPILGAVPDGCMVLFSGLGPDAQEQLSVGVGALAGSTIMLLTIPWILSILGGRVNIVDGKACYKSPKLIPPGNMSLTEVGVSLSPAVNTGSYIMMVTALTYLLLQVPGLVYWNASHDEQVLGEQNWALLGFFVCFFFFAAYLYYQYKISLEDSADSMQTLTREQYFRDAINRGDVTLLGVMSFAFKDVPNTVNGTFQKTDGSRDVGKNEKTALLSQRSARKPSISQADSDPQSPMNKLDRLLKPFFAAYDLDKSDTLSKEELYSVFHDLGERISYADFAAVFEQFDTDKDGVISYTEFVQGTAQYIQSHSHVLRRAQISKSKSIKARENADIESFHKNDTIPGGSSAVSANDDEEEEEDEEEMPEDFKDLSPEEQQRKIKSRAFYMMGLGTAIVLVVSDPMVDVLSDIGKRTNISAFYISFVLAPLASNASELIAAYNYALKKTSTSISISLATLQGACVMNNTFVLGIFMLLIYTQSLVWEFFAETLSILLVQVLIALMAMKSTHNLTHGLIILSMYPLSLILVATLESMGWD